MVYLFFFVNEVIIFGVEIVVLMVMFVVCYCYVGSFDFVVGFFGILFIVI